ncbi:hypothetical protein H6G89_08005 [Oscillatoria sp. FACHB-1407]|uniref:hypothetical protein n=1 Tax=Oscillatoria sp. FACHB-1407 TaxID=2692847 RepID=UPI0016855190|nr:hypothetical protein [Oscillatoria sp. FACHB-1407]MBD2460985.1 hypothetical protein [Oscillatoria sp. FACHB-1407]
MSTMTLAHTNGNGSAARAAAETWLTMTAREFFSGINWENNPPEVQELKLTAAQEDGAPANLLLLSVSQFFAAVNWDGMAIAPTPAPSTPEPSGKATDFTLEDFSDLF